MKTCSSCQIEKPFSEFHKDSKKGYKSECKSCRSEKAAKHYQKNAEEMRAKQKESYKLSPDRFKKANDKWRCNNKEKVDRKNAEYRANNKEKISAAIRKWTMANKDRCRSNQREWYKNNPDKARGKAERYKLKNPEKLAITRTKWYANNRDKAIQHSLDWAARNPDKRRANEANRRARKRNSDGSHTSSDIKNLVYIQKGKCACCKIIISSGYHVDHIMPLALGGSNDKTNIQLLCPACNIKKSSKHPIDFMQSRGFLL